MDHSTGKFESIQLVRAIAALLVVLYHSHFLIDNFPPGFRINLPFVYQYGYLGVDIFFVVSGFIIAHVTSSPRFRLAPFFIKRFFRIYPIWWLFCYSALISYYEFGLNLGQALEFSTIYASFLAAPTEGYPIYAVGWSLAYEIMFYLTAGIIVALFGHPLLLVILFFAGLAGLAFHLHGVSLPGVSGLVLMKFLSLYQLNFLVGVVIYKARARLRPIGVVPAALGALAGFGAAVSVPLLTPVFACVGSAFLIAAFLNAENRGYINHASVLKRGVVRVFVLVGNASFSLYLVHWIMFQWGGGTKIQLIISICRVGRLRSGAIPGCFLR